MATPSIQTLITQAQQVLNLKSSNEIRATLAAILANANVGTPLNPNLTTQQLWDEFYEIVRQPSDDIMSIITDQMMRMVFSPPAPGGAGADKQVIFNDGGVLAGDTKFLWDKNANRLDVDGPVVVTGDLTARTTGLIVNATGVGMGMTPTDNLNIGSTLYASVSTKIDSITQSSHIFKGTPDAVGYEYAKIVSGRESSPSTYGSFLAFYTESKASGITDTSVERARFNSTGNLAFANGKGIDFSAVTGGTGTATANVLNDYEEGTFTATLNGSVSDPATLITTVGRYTKVGREVTVEINFSNITTTGYSGRITIAGLPFAQNGNNEIASIVGLYGIATFTGSPFGLTTQSATTISMWSSISNGAFQAVNFNAGSGQYLWSSLTYTV